MSSDEQVEPDGLVMRVQPVDHPVAAAEEADAVDAARRYAHYIIRGPVFGLAARPKGEAGWRMVAPAVEGFPQAARDALNSYLWLKAKDDTDDRVLRRELLDAVDRLEHDTVNGLTVDGVRYRVVRAEEYVYTNENGLEPPRPADRDAVVPDWCRSSADPEVDEGFVIDHSAVTGVAAGSERLALRELRYRSERYPAAVRADSRRALETHPGTVVLPAAFRVVERTEDGWEPFSTIMATPHAARRTLVTALTEVWPRVHQLTTQEKADYDRAAARFRAAGRANEMAVRDRRFCIARIGRMVRIGRDGPEPPRPSDVDPYGPSKIRPTMDEYGNISYGDG
ncbi:hypothetical protein SAMN05216223_10481 [Actinacidiphila yanglinensis]|uniref:PE-PGRS family protein n=1 Tax=Actinacidiphila yanglinensis TaxID=310779 RepID=A0A1H5YP70_9ACTN|nr:DUF5954 family protein [Actinacidiphila yanglinensis]SEG25923.1 hypothetical protein SAMN05216223_10481 [Actinacidiphila yanglinensis]